MAEECAIAKELLQDIVNHVREKSAELRLVKSENLISEPYDLNNDQIEYLHDDLSNDEQYNDIRFMSAERSGRKYLYSATFISDSYARSLMRIEEKDPCLMIADTVREESKVYPRPTCIQLFTFAPFSLTIEGIKNHLEEIKRRAEFEDICWFKASTGVVYLYSNQFISERFARRQAEWFEVEQFENQ